MAMASAPAKGFRDPPPVGAQPSSGRPRVASPTLGCALLSAVIDQAAHEIGIEFEGTVALEVILLDPLAGRARELVSGNIAEHPGEMKVSTLLLPVGALI